LQVKDAGQYRDCQDDEARVSILSQTSPPWCTIRRQKVYTKTTNAAAVEQQQRSTLTNNKARKNQKITPREKNKTST
jgi:hypothetical protein